MSDAIVMVVVSLKQCCKVSGTSPLSERVKGMEEEFLSTCRLWLGMINQLAQVNQSQIRTCLVVTQLDRVEEKQRKVFEAEWPDLCNSLNEENVYAPIRFSTERCLLLNDARKINAVQRILFDSILVPLATEMLQGQKTPALFNKLLKSVQGARLEHMKAIKASSSSFTSSNRSLSAHEVTVRDGLCQNIDQAIKYIVINPATSQEGSRIIEDLVLLGEFIQLDGGYIITDPSWLSRIISVVVCPADKNFKGLEMHNGIVRAASMKRRLIEEGVIMEEGFENV